MTDLGPKKRKFDLKPHIHPPSLLSVAAKARPKGGLLSLEQEEPSLGGQPGCNVLRMGLVLSVPLEILGSHLQLPSFLLQEQLKKK